MTCRIVLRITPILSFGGRLEDKLSLHSSRKMGKYRVLWAAVFAL